MTRPAGACMTHLAPKPGYAWRMADAGYVTCHRCAERLHRWLSPLGKDDEGRPDNIPYFYAVLDAAPGGQLRGRRAPGFGSRSPANDHVISLADPRTVEWTDGDPWSVYGVLRQWVSWVVEQRGYAASTSMGALSPPVTVEQAAVWLDKQLDWVSRRAEIVTFDGHLRELRRQLRTAAGEGGNRPVGHCIEVLETGRCGAPIFMPSDTPPRAPDEPIVDLPELRCPACHSRYTGTRLLRLKLADRDN